METRIYTRHEMSNEMYHASEGISKSGLWTIHTKTPAHYRFAEPAEKKAEHLTFGSAVHAAILEPELLDRLYFRGPADRRGDKWSTAMSMARLNGGDLLTAGDHDKVQRIRDAADRCAVLRDLRSGLTVESSAFVTDEAGTTMRVRPDGWHEQAGLILDIKTTTDASPGAFSRSSAQYGYHVQHAFYTDVLQMAADAKVDGFIFLAMEKEPPFAIAVYELDVAAQEEGRRIYLSALAKYKECLAADRWPAYNEEPTVLSLPRWAVPQE